MSKTNPLILFLAAFGLVYIGNTVSDNGYTVLTDVLGTGLSLFGDIVLLYSLYLGARWIINRIRGGHSKPETNTKAGS